MKFHLQYAEVVKGKFDPGELNLMMVMQVNCPGCFLYGIPQMKNLHQLFNDQLSFFALATAFEDFELNTIGNARKLVNEGITIGETEKAFVQHRLSNEYTSIPFPVLVDRMVNKDELHSRQFVERVISGRPSADGNQDARKEMIEPLMNYYQNFEQCGFTFAANLLQGTPTFVLFNKEMEILSAWFGHADERDVTENLNTFLSSKK
jgi:hypothetical protein